MSELLDVNEAFFVRITECTLTVIPVRELEVEGQPVTNEVGETVEVMQRYLASAVPGARKTFPKDHFRAAVLKRLFLDIMERDDA